MEEIDVEKYCKEVSSILDQKEARVVPEQVLEVVGGIANLYLEKCLLMKVSEFKFETYDTFVSKYVERNEILQEIKNCTGISKKRSELILEAMQEVFRDNFRRHEIKEGEPLLFKPLGEFSVLDFVLDLQESKYQVYYRDPAKKDYKKFLL